MRYVSLGKTGLEVSQIALCTCAISGRLGQVALAPADAQAILRTAKDGGINFFLTCENDAEHVAEQHLAAVLAGDRDQIVIATRIGPERQHPRELSAAVEESLRTLGTDRLDLLLLDRGHPHLGPAEVLGAAARLREEGKVRAIGVSRYGPKLLAAALRPSTMPACVAADFSLLFRAPEAELEPMCRKAQVPLLATTPLLLGLLAGRYASAEDLPPLVAQMRHFRATASGKSKADLRAETFAALAEIRRIAADLGEPMGDVALAWLLSRPSVACAAVSASTTIQVRRNTRGGNLVLPPAAAEALSRATQRLSELLGRSLDMWQDPPRWT